MHQTKRTALALVLVLSLLLAACGRPASGPTSTGLGADIDKIVQERGLDPDQVAAAVKTYIPTGEYDPYIMFASTGHAGQIAVIGIPSMRLLRVIGVFTPEPWQGHGFNDDDKKMLTEGGIDGRMLTWGDTHHPAISETNGEYDGQYLFIADKAHSRVAVIDLSDFRTKQMIKNPVSMSDHGATFVTPNTEYVIQGGQYGNPLGMGYAPIERYKEDYRNAITLWKFDRSTGRIDEAASFSLEVPPYWQDLCDAGKGVSEGWVFCNSINSELHADDEIPYEVGVSQHDMDYLHVFNWRHAEEIINAGKYEVINGHRVIRLQTSIDEGLLYLIPEPKSPHGVDVTPTGTYAVVSGKLDPHVTIYSFAKIKDAIDNGRIVERDHYGLPVLGFDDTVEAQVEVGLGPLHTQFDPDGFAYTSIFLDSTVTKWSLGPPYRNDGWKVEDKLSVHYNIGHLSTIEGDSMDPQGKWLVAMNKWSLDRFPNIGPLLPQNFQLIDISGDKMQLMYDMPIGFGEPHYAQMIRREKLNPKQVYPQGTDAHAANFTQHPNFTPLGQERVERNGNQVTIYQTAIRSRFVPQHIRVKKGDHITWHITNPEQALDAIHGFGLPYYNIQLSLEPGETQTISFVADRAGVYPWYCTEFCSALHLEMIGYLLVEP